MCCCCSSELLQQQSLVAVAVAVALAVAVPVPTAVEGDCVRLFAASGASLDCSCNISASSAACANCLDPWAAVCKQLPQNNPHEGSAWLCVSRACVTAPIWRARLAAGCCSSAVCSQVGCWNEYVVVLRQLSVRLLAASVGSCVCGRHGSCGPAGFEANPAGCGRLLCHL